MKIGLLGGSFSPVTLGHILVAKVALKVVDKVVLIPCNKHSFGKSLINPMHRVNMCKLAVEDKISVDDFEIRQDLPGDTYTLIKKLKDNDYFMGASLYFIVGMDEALNFNKWINYTDLKKIISFIVVPREGVGLKNKRAWFLKSPHMLLIPEIPIPAISSTDIRRGFSLQDTPMRREVLEFCRKYLNSKVYDYIIKNGLYK